MNQMLYPDIEVEKRNKVRRSFFSFNEENLIVFEKTGTLRSPVVLNSEEAKMYSLSRGELAVYDETHLKKMQQLLREGKFGDVKSAIITAKLSQDFSGTFYSVFFKVSKPIILKSVGFWGPFAENTGDYRVNIVISRIGARIPVPFDPARHAHVMEKVGVIATAEKKKIFDVPIPQEVKLYENVWHQIKFQLDGPETCICSAIKSYYTCMESGVDFEFFDSSHQLPRITFSSS